MCTYFIKCGARKHSENYCLPFDILALWFYPTGCEIVMDLEDNTSKFQDVNMLSLCSRQSLRSSDLSLSVCVCVGDWLQDVGGISFVPCEDRCFFALIICYNVVTPLYAKGQVTIIMCSLPAF